jgi:hypothetical protein
VVNHITRRGGSLIFSWTWSDDIAGRSGAPGPSVALALMEKRVWLTSVDSELEVTKTEPASIGLNVAVTVRPGQGVHLDGVWLNGQRSFDTYIVINGVVSYHSPVESVGEQAFEFHEAAGGGVTL